MAKRAEVTRKAGGAKKVATKKTRATRRAAPARRAGGAGRTEPIRPGVAVPYPGSAAMPARTRAWLLVTAANPASAQTQIGQLMLRGNGQIPDEDVVVRADTVNGGFDLVVPVDASGTPGLSAIVGLISRMSGVRHVDVLQVVDYMPKQVVEAHCFIHPSERRFPFLWKGRYGKSPGWNPWG